jgi:competence protein ComEA
VSEALVSSLTRRDQLAIGLVAAGVLCAAGAAWLLLTAGQISSSPPTNGALSGSVSPVAQPTASFAPAADLVIDVQGAVKRPGVVLLAPGARVADALAAAGGYSRQADLNAAAASLNLAALLADGAQVYVPIIGAPSAGGRGTSAGGGTSGGGTGGGGSTLVNVNTATPEELEALPGIGPVTVQKIVAARAEQPFATLDEMVEREVIDRGQLEDIRDLVTF